jgi:hypothetical protein
VGVSHYSSRVGLVYSENYLHEEVVKVKRVGVQENTAKVSHYFKKTANYHASQKTPSPISNAQI